MSQAMSNQGRAILLAVGGGIAAYKSAMLCSRLVQGGHDVRTAMTKSADAVHWRRDARRALGQAGRVRTCSMPAYPLGAAHRTCPAIWI